MVEKNNIICPFCHKDSGIPRVLHMVIPQNGLACNVCGKTIVNGPHSIKPYKPPYIDDYDDVLPWKKEKKSWPNPYKRGPDDDRESPRVWLSSTRSLSCSL